VTTTETVLVPGPRSVTASLDTDGRAACVVACPPHPEMGGSRSDRRLRAIADAVEADHLRFDYGVWDEGRGEITDCLAALAWARERYDRVGLFGYSFGAAVALVAGARETADGTPPVAVSVLAPPARTGDLDAVGAVPAVGGPLQVVTGERDTTVDSGPVVAAARAREDGHARSGEAAAAGDPTDIEVLALSADHHFLGQDRRVGEAVATFLDPWLAGRA
jgi:alpha/beta superfamily hydrolase